MTPKTFVEFFAGIGLVRLGLEGAGWQVLFANDFDQKKLEMYRLFYNDGSSHYKLEDIFKLNAEDIPSSTLATSSFPCVDLSVAGKQQGIYGKHSSAFWGFVAILRDQKETRPPLVMLENVPGWLTSNNGEDFRTTVQELNKLGYACDVFSIDAIRFTPQSRERIFLIGTRHLHKKGGLDIFLSRAASLKTPKLLNAVLNNADLDWSFCPTPELPQKKTTGLREIIEEIASDDPRWWPQSEVSRHISMMSQAHYDLVTKLSKEKTETYRTFFRRKRSGGQRVEVRKQETAGCLRTARGGSAIQFLIKVGNGEIAMRRMTPREYARLQGAPDNYPVPKNTIQGLTGFGDAVAVPVITWVGQNILNPLLKQMELENAVQSLEVASYVNG